MVAVGGWVALNSGFAFTAYLPATLSDPYCNKYYTAITNSTSQQMPDPVEVGICLGETITTIMLGFAFAASIAAIYFGVRFLPTKRNVQEQPTQSL